MSTALTLADARVLSSREAVDGSEWIAEAVYPGGRVHELAAGRHIVAPSGREYRISELRWTPRGRGYKVRMVARDGRP